MDRVFNQEPENAVLSILLRHPKSYEDLIVLKPIMMSSDPARWVLDAIIELNKSGVSPEANLVKAYLVSNNKLGIDQFISYLTSLSYDETNIKEFEKLVVESYKAQTIVNLSSRAQQAILEGKKVDETLSFLRDGVDKLSDESSENQTVEVSSVIDQSISALDYRIEHPGITGMKTGFSKLDIITNGFFPSDVVVIAARPSQGKSLFMCNLALGAAKNGNGVCIFSLEMQKNALVERMLAAEAEIDATNLKYGNISKTDYEKIKSAAERIRGLPIHIDSNYQADLEYMLSTAKKLNRDSGTKIFFVDYLQLLAERNAESVHELGQISRGFKLLSNQIGVCSVLLSQLNRQVELREDKRPILSDIRQSGDIEQDTDIAMFLYRDEYYNPNTRRKNELEVLIRKNRQGTVGSLFYNFLPEYQKVTEQ